MNGGNYMGMDELEYFSPEWRAARVVRGDAAVNRAMAILDEDRENSSGLMLAGLLIQLAHAHYAAANVRGSRVATGKPQCVCPECRDGHA